MVKMPTVASWTYQNKVITSIEDMPKGTYGFIYEVLYFERNKKLGKKALKLLQEERSKQGLRGRTPLKEKIIIESDWISYFGSQKEILTISKKDNSNKNWEKHILQFVPNKKLLTYYETKYLFKNGILEDKYSNHINDNILGKFFRKDFD